MNKFNFLSIVFCCLFLPLFTNAQVVDPLAPPNIILIVADDMGWNDVGYHGSEIRTPTIDRLAKEGVELNRFYVHPTCSPTRFGGEEDREPYGGMEGVNAGPLRPIYYIVPAFFLLLFLFIWWRWKRKRRCKMIG